jgi:N-acetylmuramoyl-L-alanine amidase
MSKKVYISPSDQTENRYAWGNTNEHVQCQKIAEAEAAALRRSGVEVKLAAFGTTMAQRCAESDAWRADIHNCVHTNACNGKVMGTRLFCFAVPGKGYDACKAVFAELAPLTPGTSENIQANSRLYEVRVPDAPSVYCECEFHDTAEGAKWIVGHTTEIGEAIAKGLCKYLGVAFVPAQTQKPAEEPKADAEQVLYRVQVGAFAVRANADRMLEKLKAAGFAGFVVKGKK